MIGDIPYPTRPPESALLLGVYEDELVYVGRQEPALPGLTWKSLQPHCESKERIHHSELLLNNDPMRK